MQIIPLSAEHWPAVRAIYLEGIATGHATFQTEAPSWDQWHQGHLPHSRLVVIADDAGAGLGAGAGFAAGAGFGADAGLDAGVGFGVGARFGAGADADPGAIAGWAALSPVSARPVYAGVAEVSIYLRAGQRGRRMGLALLHALVEESERHGIWTLQAGIFPENIPSLKIHAHCGFREVGYRERVGAMGGVWRDTVLLERRSTLVGV